MDRLQDLHHLPFDKTAGSPGSACRVLPTTGQRTEDEPRLEQRRCQWCWQPEAPYGRNSTGQLLYGPINYHDYQTSWYRWPNLDLSRQWHQDMKYMNQLGFIFEVPLGRGGFGEVWRVYNINNHRHLAAKIMSVAKFEEWGYSLNQGMAFMLREIEHVRGLKHPGVVSIESVINIKDTKTDFQSLFIIMFMELMHGSLTQAIKESPEQRMNETAAIRWFQQIASAMCYMHSQQVSHMDIKSDNILFHNPTQQGGPMIFKLVDFGLTQTFHAQSREMMSTEVVGTDYILAPEMTGYTNKFWSKLGQQKPFDTSRCDIYSLGVTLAQSLIGVPHLKPPYNMFNGRFETAIWVDQHLIKTGRFKVTSPMIQLIQFMIYEDPAMRMTSEQLQQHINAYIPLKKL